MSASVLSAQVYQPTEYYACNEFRLLGVYSSAWPCAPLMIQSSVGDLKQYLTLYPTIRDVMPWFIKFIDYL